MHELRRGQRLETSVRPDCAGEFTRQGSRMQRRVFWLTLFALGLIADVALPLMWGLLATIPIAALSWWIAYRSGWFQ